jgi:hypothetical protein
MAGGGRQRLDKRLRCHSGKSIVTRVDRCDRFREASPRVAA